MKRPERRAAHGRLETAEIVRPDERDPFLVRGRVARDALGLANLLRGHAETEVPGAAQADVDAGLVPERRREGLVEIAAQAAEEGNGIPS